MDNLKAGVIKPDIYDPVLNETYAELSRFYGFSIDPAKVCKPEHKGKVERSIRIVKEQLIAGRSYTSVEDANTKARIWCKDIVSYVICTSTGRKPIDVFNCEEKPELVSLPSGVFDMPEWTIAKVHKDHHFITKGNFYSVPTKYIGKEITVRIGLKTVSAYFEHKIIKTHPRQDGKGQWITDQKDYPEKALYYLEKTPEICVQAAKEIGAATHQIIVSSLEPFTRVGMRKTQAILRLAEKYDKQRLELACRRAIDYDNYDYKTLENILQNQKDKLDEERFTSKKTAY